MLADDADPDTVWSTDVASIKLIIADARDRILDVAFRMLGENIHHIAVQRDDEIIGVVLSRDFLALLADTPGSARRRAEGSPRCFGEWACTQDSVRGVPRPAQTRTPPTRDTTRTLAT